MGKAKKAAKKQQQPSDDAAQLQAGREVINLFVVVLLGIAVGAAFALFPSSSSGDEWKGPTRYNAEGYPYATHGTGKTPVTEGTTAAEPEIPAEKTVRAKTATENSATKLQPKTAPAATVNAEEGGAAKVVPASRFGVGNIVGKRGGKELKRAFQLSQSGDHEPALRDFVAAWKLANELEVKQRIAYTMLLQWKQPCVDLNRDLCRASWLDETLAEIEATAEELQLSGDDYFNMGYILQSRREHERALAYYEKAETVAAAGALTRDHALVNQAVMARMLDRPKLADNAERRRWENFAFPPTHRNAADDARCQHATPLFCNSWDELWAMPSIPEPIKHANQLQIKSEIRTLEIKHTDGSPSHTFCLPQVDTGHVILENVSVFGRDLWMYNDCTFFACGFRLPSRDSAFSSIDGLDKPKAVVTLDRAAVLPPKHMRNFYHFAVEGMTNMALLFDQVFPGLSREPLPNQDKPLVLLVGASSQGERIFAYEIFVLISKARPDIALTLEWYDVKKRYDIGELHLVDWYPSPDPIAECPDGSSPASEAFSSYYAPCELIEKHAALMHSTVSRKVPEQDTIVFFSRSTSPRDDRRLVNEELLLGPLKSRILDFNIAHGTRYRLATHDGSLTVEEQIRLLRRAKVAFGTHGAGMSTVMHTLPGAALIEFALDGPDVHQFFKHIATCVGAEYYVADGLVSRFHDNLVLESPRHDKAIADFIDTVMDILTRALPEE